MVEKNAEIWTGKGKLLLSDIQFPGIKLATTATAAAAEKNWGKMKIDTVCNQWTFRMKEREKVEEEERKREKETQR